MRMAAQEGFDRFVLEFAGTGTPTYFVRYVDGPVTDTSGAEIAVEGSALLSVVAFPARTFDFEDPDFAKTYEGPLVIRSDTRHIIEAKFIEDFEATMEWVLGLESQTGFEVSVLNDPPRLVVDVATP